MGQSSSTVSSGWISVNRRPGGSRWEVHEKIVAMAHVCYLTLIVLVQWLTVSAQPAAIEHWNSLDGEWFQTRYSAGNDHEVLHTLHQIVQDYLAVNASGTIRWSNPDLVLYDKRLIAAITSNFEAETEKEHDYVPGLLYNSGMKFLTYYCGPGNWSSNGDTSSIPYFSSIDRCCKTHDECPDTIVSRRDYQRYPSLPYKEQMFTRLSCSCDVAFLQCLQDISSFFSYSVAWIYTKFQTHCFEYEHPVVKCGQSRNDGFFSSERCLRYRVDNSYKKQWQWFDVPYMSAKQLLFPVVDYLYDLNWFDILRSTGEVIDHQLGDTGNS